MLNIINCFVDLNSVIVLIWSMGWKNFSFGIAYHKYKIHSFIRAKQIEITIALNSLLLHYAKRSDRVIRMFILSIEVFAKIADWFISLYFIFVFQLKTKLVKVWSPFLILDLISFPVQYIKIITSKMAYIKGSLQLRV